MNVTGAVEFALSQQWRAKNQYISAAIQYHTSDNLTNYHHFSYNDPELGGNTILVQYIGVFTNKAPHTHSYHPTLPPSPIYICK